MHETELISRCQSGETNARKRLYELYGEALLSLCYRYTGDQETAYDLLHDGFLKVFSSISSFQYKGEGSLKAWMNKVFVNLALESLRKKDFIRDGISLEEVSELTDETEPDAELLSIDQLMRFVADLPVGYRTVFNLYVLEEWSHKEIAQELNIQEKSSASQLNRARKLLADRIRKELKRQEYSNG